MVLETFSVSHGKASAYLPVIDLLHGYFEIDRDDDDARKRREKVNGKIAYARSLAGGHAAISVRAARYTSRSDDPLAQMDAQVRKRRTLEAIKRILVRESLNQPLMVIFEDLHWIDEETQALLNLLADSIGTAKILLLVNYRPEYSSRVGQQDLLHASCGSIRSARRAPRRCCPRCSATARELAAAQAPHHRADRGQSVLHGRDRAGAVR